jgi:hypothetical protein
VERSNGQWRTCTIAEAVCPASPRAALHVGTFRQRSVHSSGGRTKEPSVRKGIHGILGKIAVEAEAEVEAAVAKN